MKFFLGSDTDKQDQPIKIPHQDSDAAHVLSSQLIAYLDRDSRHRSVSVVCIGTDRSTGDSLGPLIGTQLAKKELPGVDLYGTLDEPVHAMNLQETMTHIREKHVDPYIIAIDACLGQLTSVGHIQLASGPLRPGAGVNKELPPVGDIHMTGIVNVGGFMEYFVLQNTRLSLVIRMADIMAQAIFRAVISRSVLPRPEWGQERFSLPLDR